MMRTVELSWNPVNPMARVINGKPTSYLEAPRRQRHDARPGHAAVNAAVKPGRVKARTGL